MAAGAAASAAAMLQQDYRTIAVRLDREVAFRAAEAALLDGEAELQRGWSSGGTGFSTQWPAPGLCGQGPRRHHCTPAAGQVPRWGPWLVPAFAPVEGLASRGSPGAGFGTITGATFPAIPPEMGGGLAPPRYLIERLGAAPASYPAGSVRFRITAIASGRVAGAGAGPAGAESGPIAAPTARAILQSEWVASARPPDIAAASAPPSGRVAWRELIPEPAR
ncbi:pilus assembly PilX family protein [Paracidovorax citrulli]